MSDLLVLILLIVPVAFTYVLGFEGRVKRLFGREAGRTPIEARAGT